ARARGMTGPPGDLCAGVTRSRGVRLGAGPPRATACSTTTIARFTMVPQHWSVNGLATELGVDRRTIARRLHALRQAGSGPHGPLYLMREVYRELTGWC